MTTLWAAPEVNETVVANCLTLFLTVSRKRPSSEPLMTMYEAPISLHTALATVVFPTPAEPHKRRLGISFCSRKASNDSLIFFHPKKLFIHH